MAKRSVEQAADVIARRSSFERDDMINVKVAARDGVREAMSRTHPDAGGSTVDFQLVQEARRVLEAHHGGLL